MNWLKFKPYMMLYYSSTSEKHKNRLIYEKLRKTSFPCNGCIYLIGKKIF